MAVITGNDEDNVLRGTNKADTIYGKDGDDVINGRGGDDIIYAGDGDDVVESSPGDDIIYGEEGNDILEGGTGDDVIYGGPGDDRMNGDQGSDRFIITEAGNDRVFGGEDCDGKDIDVLDLSAGLGTAYADVNVLYDPNDPEAGTVQFLDDQGTVTGTLTFKEIEKVIVCFTPGTMIATPKGLRPVQDLRTGDRIITRDNGIQEVRWTGRSDVGAAAMAAAPHLRPILVRAGALGNGMPDRDMMVSPSHRMLVASDRSALYFNEHEVLVAAKHLLHMPGIERAPVQDTAYLHFLCDRHEVVLSDGTWTESFQPGDHSLGGMDHAQRAEIFELFPDLATAPGLAAYTAARKTLKRHEARLLA